MCTRHFSFVFSVVLATTLATTVSGQVDRWSKPVTPTATTPAPTPTVPPTATTPAPTPTTPAPAPTPTVPPTTPGLDEARVKEIVGEAIKAIPAPTAPTAGTEDAVARATAKRAEGKVDKVNTYATYGMYGVGVILVLAVLFFAIRWFRNWHRDNDLPPGGLGLGGPGAAAIALIFCFAFAGSVSAQPLCWSVESNKTMMTAVAGESTEFACSISGKTVTVQDKAGAKVVDGVIKTSKPLTFTATVPNAGRYVAVIDGRTKLVLWVTPDGGTATLLQAGVDLAPSRPDTTARATASKAVTEIKNVNGRLVEVETRVSKLEATDKILADANNSLEARVKAVEAKPAPPTYDDSALRTELSRTNATLAALDRKVNAVATDLAATDKVAREARDTADEVKGVVSASFRAGLFGGRGSLVDRTRRKK